MTCAKTRGAITKEWPLCERESGLIEMVCPHGIGHPSKVLTPPQLWKDWMAVHGCDGCCRSTLYAVAEAAHNRR